MNPVATAAMLREAKILGAYCQCFLTMLRGQGVGIEAHLVNLSKLAHLALVIYRRQRTKFIPAQNFQNTMRDADDPSDVLDARTFPWSVRRVREGRRPSSTGS